MPLAAIGLGLGTALAGGAAAGATIYGAKKQASAASDAAKLQTDAANHAADLQAKATADALAFQRQQAETDWQNAQQTQLANYNQAKARYGSIAGVASQYGLNLGDMPAYAPGIDPHFDTAGTPLPASPTTPNAAGTVAGSAPQNFGNLGDPSAWMSLVGNDAQLASWVKAQNPGLSDSLTSYYVGKIKGQPGANATEQAGSANYWAQKIKSDPTTGGGSTGSIAAAAKSASPFAMTAPLMGAPVVNTAIPTPYQPGSIAAVRRLV